MHYKTWHDCLGHPEIGIMRKFIGNYIGHNLKEAKISKHIDFMFTACATGKLILRSSPLKIHIEPLKFLERV
jgi:hypothetical protein